MTSGKFVTFEGPEGAGKSTQVRLLARALQSAGLDTIVTREPGGSAGSEEIRALLVRGAADRWEPLTETLLHFAARRQHLVGTIRPALERGSWVVCDRFADSTLAYQSYGQGVPSETVTLLQSLVVGETEPDLTLMLDVPPDVGLSRAKMRGGDARYENMDLEMHRRVAEGFREIASRDPARCVIIDAHRSVDTVHEAVLESVRERLGLTL